MKKTIPCIARCADGSPCGRRIPLGTTPQVCHVHAAQAAGGNNGTPFTAADLDPLDVLRRDMRSSEASVRVRAATELLAEERRRRAESENITADDRAFRAFVAALTDEERAQLNERLALIRLIKARVHQRCPEARPANYCEPIQVATDAYEPGTLFLHPEKQCVCEAAALSMPAPPEPAPEEPDDEEVEEEETEDIDPLTIPPED